MRYGDERYQALVEVISVEDYFERWEAFERWMDEMGWVK